MAHTNTICNGCAQAAHVWLRLDCAADRCTLTVADDGCGFDVQQVLDHPEGMQAVGLIGMQERAELLGGQLKVRSRPGQGTVVSALIPL